VARPPPPAPAPRTHTVRARLSVLQGAALVVLALAVVAIAAIAASVWRADQAAIERDWADRAATTLVHEVDEGGVTLRGLRGLLDAHPSPTTGEFTRYGAATLNRTRIVGAAWLPRVPDASRASFERRTGITILDVAGRRGSVLTRSPRRAEYFPFLHLAQGPVPDVVVGVPGLDLLGYAGQQGTPAALDAARRTGDVRMIGVTPTPQGMMVPLVAAVYAPGDTPGPGATPRGIVLASFMLDTLVAPVLEGLPPGSRFALFEGPRLIHGGRDAGGTAVSVAVAGGTWTLRLDAPTAWGGLAMPAGLLVGGMAMVGVLALLFVQGNRREDESGRVAAEQAALRRVATAAAASPEDVVTLIAREAALLTGADLGLVCRFDDDHARTLGVWGEERMVAPRAVRLDGEGVLARVAHSGEPARIEDYAALPAGDALAGPEWTRNVASAVAAPVRVGGSAWGAVLVARHGRSPWADDTEERLARFAELAAAAISSAEARRDLALQATTDPLTGLANRRTFEERLDAETARARRTGRPLALALIDVDHFKRVNDTHGHQAGDRVLTEIARRLSAIARPQDLLARVGGEEIAWLMGDTEMTGAHEAAERGRRRIGDDPFTGIGTVTISGGVCDLRRAPAAGGIVRGADIALYQAKERGRDAIVRASSTRGPAAAGATPAGSSS